MQNKSYLNINTGESSDNSTNDSPTEEFSVENAPIHSMEKDLKMIDNPEMMRSESASLPISSDSRYASSSKISPFLEKTNIAPVTPSSQKKIENIASKPLMEQALESETPDSSSKNTFKRVFVFSTIFLSVIALGIGSYYFWLVKGEESESPSEESEAIVPVSETAAPVPEPAPSTVIIEPVAKPEKPKENIIILELENSTYFTLRESLTNQIKNLTDFQSAAPLEFKLQDSKNNPISLQIFGEKAGITFVKDFSAYLGESFRFFVSKDGPQFSLGLILESKNDAWLAKEILKKEPLLIEDLNILLLEKFEKPAKVSFSNNTYKDLPIRYFNILSPEKLTIDYAITKNKLLFGTTKNTLYALYDLILSQSNNSP